MNIQTFQLALKSDIESHEELHPPYDNVTKAQRKALSVLKNRSDVVITRADKGGATFTCGIEEYLAEANSQLNNPNFYQDLSMDPFNDYHQIIINSLNEMLSNNMIDKETAEVLKPKDVTPRPIVRITQNTQKEHPWKACDLISKLPHYKIIMIC